MKRHQERHQKPYNVEFGMEFGDINAAKLYELPYAGKKEKHKDRKDK
ncbi:hypothetical protein M3204_02120 [Mesobacillus subterraneus]|jgi:hypothetical protein|nr:hypothetical protein [Mesobacillus subterraneus]MCM3663183.1 hypothetical protein [Mesobacillus subterraneus]MCM3682643.1 hypothetical protein [Mesobacillus subterraneus]